jgi:hypothetical protein
MVSPGYSMQKRAFSMPMAPWKMVVPEPAHIRRASR